jgi:uronate dehydrogenase
MSAAAASKPLLLTGAAGNLGGFLRPHLARRAEGLRSTDLRAFGPALAGEEIMLGDLADAAAVDRLVRGTSAILHFGAIGVEDSFERILQANIRATYNIFEATRRHGIKRIVYASSIHVIGLYPTTLVADSETPPRPDSYYGISKAFGENLARLYVEKAGLEIASLRIGVAAPEPKTPRNLWTWLSIPDLCRLVDACLAAPNLGFAVVYGVSANRRRWWDNSRSAIGFRPENDAESYAERILPDGGISAADQPGLAFHGGPFVRLKLGERP